MWKRLGESRNPAVKRVHVSWNCHHCQKKGTDQWDLKQVISSLLTGYMALELTGNSAPVSE